jgi:hypothetical protein
LTVAVIYGTNINAHERRTAVLGVGQQRALWTYWGMHEGRYVVHFPATGDTPSDEQYLTGDEVDQLLFHHFTNEANW